MVVRMRHTRAHTGHRRSHHALEAVRLTTDKDGVMHQRHRASAETGRYRGRQVIDIAGKMAKRHKKAQSRSQQAQETKSQEALPEPKASAKK